MHPLNEELSRFLGPALQDFGKHVAKQGYWEERQVTEFLRDHATEVLQWHLEMSDAEEGFTAAASAH